MRRSPTLIIKVTMAHNALSGLLIRPCDRCIVAACILGSVKEVVARLTSAADQGPSPETIVDEIVNFGLRGIFYDQARGLWGLMSRTKGPEKGGNRPTSMVIVTGR